MRTAGRSRPGDCTRVIVPRITQPRSRAHRSRSAALAVLLFLGAAWSGSRDQSRSVAPVRSGSGARAVRDAMLDMPRSDGETTALTRVLLRGGALPGDVARGVARVAQRATSGLFPTDHSRGRSDRGAACTRSGPATLA